MFLNCTGAAVEVDGEVIPFPCAPENNRYSADEKADRVRITFTYQTITVPATVVEVSYEVTADGQIKYRQSLCVK